jgi:serine phosphatase RsbU (regulator of sigma subunit)
LHAETFVPANSGFDFNSEHRDWNTLPPSMSPFDETAASSSSLREQLDSLHREKLDLHNQLFEAAQIQRKLSGPRLLRHGDLHFASEVFAARFLSGDFITFSKNGSRVFAAHGDIAGKGVAAGMWFTNLAGLLQSYGQPDSDPANIASEVNRHLCYLRPVAPFVTGFIAQIDCDRGELTYCNAGHFPPLLLHQDGSSDLLQEGGPLLGAIEAAEFRSATLFLAPGDTLVAYSDGVLECANPAGEEFGTERLLETLRCAEGQSAHTKLMMILAALQDFANGTPPRDDISLTVIQRDASGQ